MSHHRGHVRNFLDEASESLYQAQTTYGYYLRYADVPETVEYQLHRRWSAYYMAHTGQAIVEILVALRGDPPMLDIARRIINQPRANEPRAALREVQHGCGHMTALQAFPQAEPTKQHNARDLQAACGHLIRCWASLDRATWHVNDAIREEIYEDPAFGPPV